MKKSLLSAAVLLLTTASASANVTTLAFDGEGDAYGMVRQTATNVNDIEFVPDISLKEAGIEFTLSKGSESGNGFALINTGGTNSGIYIYSGLAPATFITPHIDLTVPGGKITAIKFSMSGSNNNVGLISLDLKFNNSVVSGEKEDALFAWNWSNDEGCETVSIEWNNTYYVRYIHSIEVTYSIDLAGKEECGLAFSETSAEGILGETFSAPELSNPHDLSLTWASSDENVATVDAEGNVSLVGAGKTFITVATDGDDYYAAGNARYELVVIPSASNIAQMKEVAPEVYDRVKVTFPVTVYYASLNNAYVEDGEGNAACFENATETNNTGTVATTFYKVGDVIPAGWIATNNAVYNNNIWSGIPDDVTETVEVAYRQVDAITTADACKVLTLKEVTFTNATPGENSKVFATTPDGTSYEFQNTFGIAEKPAGIYNVTCVVMYAKRGETVYFYLAPIDYSEYNGAEIAGEEVKTPRYYNLLGNEVQNPGVGLYIKVIGGKAEKVILK